MRKLFNGIIKFITRPFITIAVNSNTDRMVKFLNKHSYILLILSFFITAGIVFLIYFLHYV
ncbi:MAG: hypothetical protein GX232_02595 [Acholeplasmataceae bacterium]|jgi:hypothetical protein|nr:hypothetical protein [Acholeplasmataceae bacterium]